VGGQCVSACNPPCGAGEECTAAQQCVRTDGAPPLKEEATPEDDRAVSLVGVRGFGGIVLGGGASLHSWRAASGNQLDRPTTWGSFLFALRAGLLVQRLEISLEWAPGTYEPVMGKSSDAYDNGLWLTSFTGSFAYHIPVTRGAYWPLRIGAGFISRSTETNSAGRRVTDSTDFQGRIDLFNISVKTKYVFLDFSFPSVRYVTDFDAFHRWSGLFTVGAAYVSP
jgi:hypothetical protein